MNYGMVLIGGLAIICNYGLILLFLKLFGKLGLYICIPIVIIIANIQVVVAIDVFGMAMTLGNIAYVSTYLITDLLGEIYNKKDAQLAVNIGFLSLVAVTILMNVMLLTKPYVHVDSVDLYNSVQNIFSLMPRIMFASMVAYLASQSLDVIVYSRIKNKVNKSGLWFRNNISTVSSQIIDGLIFTFIAFYGMFSLSIVLEIFITTFLIKTLIAFFDTPFMYLGVKMYKENWVNGYDVVKSKKVG